MYAFSYRKIYKQCCDGYRNTLVSNLGNFLRSHEFEFFWLSGNFWLVFLQINIFAYLCIMKPEQLLRAILPDVLIDNFDIVSFDKSADRFDIYLDEKKVQLKEDKYNPEIIAYGFGEYRVIQDYPIRGRATYLHVRKRKWLDKSSNEIFSYDWDLSEFDGTRLNSEFVSFLKEGD